MKLLIIILTVLFAQVSKADKVITGSELETYKNAAIKAVMILVLAFAIGLGLRVIL